MTSAYINPMGEIYLCPRVNDKFSIFDGRQLSISRRGLIMEVNKFPWFNTNVGEDRCFHFVIWDLVQSPVRYSLSTSDPINLPPNMIKVNMAQARTKPAITSVAGAPK